MYYIHWGGGGGEAITKLAAVFLLIQGVPHKLQRKFQANTRHRPNVPTLGRFLLFAGNAHIEVTRLYSSLHAVWRVELTCRPTHRASEAVNHFRFPPAQTGGDYLQTRQT